MLIMMMQLAQFLVYSKSNMLPLSLSLSLLLSFISSNERENKASTLNERDQ